jgi:hypothetical protein
MMHNDVEVYLHVFLILVFGGVSGQCQALTALPWGRIPTTNWTGDWVNHRACLHA